MSALSTVGSVYRGGFTVKKLVVCMTALCAALAFAPAGLAHANPSLSTVLAHTRAADVALDRAIMNFNAHALGAGRNALATNRAQMGKAVAEKAKLINEASTPAERLAAAKAVVAVAKQAGTDATAFARVARVLPRGGALQLAVVRAAKADAARSTAVAKLTELLASAPDAAQSGLTKALARLMLTHRPTVTQLGRDVTSRAVGSAAKAAAAAAISADVTGQARAINVIQALQPLLPAQAQNGIATALAAIAKSLDAQSRALEAVEAHAPEALRAKILAAITKAHAAADDARS
jgi:hypothetical protein